jgi:hypothetical protein
MKAATTGTTSNYPRKHLPVLMALASLLLGVTLLRYCSTGGVPIVEPMVVLERPRVDDSATVQSVPAPSKLPDDGEVYRTAARLREASALALAAALFAADEASNRRSISGAGALVAGVRLKGLLPPGVTVTAAAMLQSDSSRLTLRFRPEPIAIEVLSFPLARENGPAIMIRIPTVDEMGQHGSVFIADRLGEIDPPSAFASITDCVRAGWIDQSFDQAEIPVAELAQLRAWLAAKHSSP